MIEFTTSSEFLEGGLVGLSSVASVMFYLRYVDSRLMVCQRPLSAKLTLTKYFRGLAAGLIAAGLVTTPVILKLGLAGTTSELIFALLMTSLVLLTVGYMLLQFFLTRVYIAGDTVTICSPLGQAKVNLGNLMTVKLNSRFQLELADTNGTVRFCHFVEGKRALIEHIIERAPSSAIPELQQYLLKAGQRKHAATCQ